MATSGNEKTRLGASMAGVGIKLTITAKDPSTGALLIAQARSIGRFVFSRIFSRVN